MIELGISTFGETTEIEGTGITPKHDERIRNMIEEMKLADKVGLDLYAIGEHHREDFAVSAPEILLASGSATYVVDNLEKKGYVIRKICQKDKRVTYIGLTETGMKLIDDIFPIHKKNTKRIFEKINDKELVILKEILKKIN